MLTWQGDGYLCWIPTHPAYYLIVCLPPLVPCEARGCLYSPATTQGTVCGSTTSAMGASSAPRGGDPDKWTFFDKLTFRWMYK